MKKKEKIMTTLCPYEEKKHQKHLVDMQPTSNPDPSGTQCVLILENEAGSVLGQIRYEPLFDKKTGEWDASKWYICWICAKSGHGSDLLLKFETLARSKGIKEIHLKCCASNGESEKTVLTRFNFYQKHEYRFVGVSYDITNEEDGFSRVAACFERMKPL